MSGAELSHYPHGNMMATEKGGQDQYLQHFSQCGHSLSVSIGASCWKKKQSEVMACWMSEVLEAIFSTANRSQARTSKNRAQELDQSQETNGALPEKSVSQCKRSQSLKNG